MWKTFGILELESQKTAEPPRREHVMTREPSHKFSVSRKLAKSTLYEPEFTADCSLPTTSTHRASRLLPSHQSNLIRAIRADLQFSTSVPSSLQHKEKLPGGTYRPAHATARDVLSRLVRLSNVCGNKTPMMTERNKKETPGFDALKDEATGTRLPCLVREPNATLVYEGGFRHKLCMAAQARHRKS